MDDIYTDPQEGGEDFEVVEMLEDEEEQVQVQVQEEPGAMPGAPVYQEFPPTPLIGPHVTGLGRVHTLMGKTSGEIETDAGEIVNFLAINVIGGKEPALRDHVAMAHEEEQGVLNATVVVPIQVHQGSPVPVELAKVKSYSSRNRYGFVQLLSSEDESPDVHFHSAICTTTDGLQKERVCAVQVDRSVQGRPRCCFLQPLLEQKEIQEFRAAGLSNAPQVGVGAPVVPAADNTLPNVDLSPMNLPPHVAQDPAVIRAAQEAAAAAARKAAPAAEKPQPHAALLQGGYAHSYPYQQGAAQPSEGEAEGENGSSSNYSGTHQGTVKSWSSVNKYGFLRPDAGGKDVHVQINVLNGLQSLSPGERVSFTYDANELPRRRAASVWKAGGSGAPGGNKAVNRPRIVGAPYNANKPRTVPTQPVEAALPPPPPPPPGPQVVQQGAPKPSMVFSQENTGTGTVKSYFAGKGFGFIVCDTTGQDIFFSTQQLADANLPGANPGDRFGFSTATNETRAHTVWRL